MGKMKNAGQIAQSLFPPHLLVNKIIFLLFFVIQISVS